MAYQVVRVGFDTIIMIFRIAELPKALCEQLIDAKDRAHKKRSPEPVKLGEQQIPGEVLARGVQGGYDAVFSTGELGEMIQFKTAENNDQWRIRLKIRAHSLLINGYQGAVKQAYDRLCAIVPRFQEARLGEVHPCIDVLTDRASFRLDEKLLTRPGRAVIRPYGKLTDDHPLADDDPEIRRILRGETVQTLLAGSHSTGSQTIIYNKRDEATLRHNWLLFEAYGLDRHDPSWALFRVEPRFSGPVLKHHFAVRDFHKLDNQIRAMMNWATTRLRYVLPEQQHVHPTRRALHPFWECVREAAATFPIGKPSIILPSRAQEILDREKSDTLQKSVIGAFIARQAMTGADAETISRTLPDSVADMMRQAKRDAPDKMRESIERAVARHTSTRH